MQHLFQFGIHHYIKYTNNDSCGDAVRPRAGALQRTQTEVFFLFFSEHFFPHAVKKPLQVRQLKAECSGQSQ